MRILSPFFILYSQSLNRFIVIENIITVQFRKPDNGHEKRKSMDSGNSLKMIVTNFARIGTELGHLKQIGLP